MNEIIKNNLPISETRFDAYSNRAKNEQRFSKLDFSDIKKSWGVLGENIEKLTKKLAMIEVSTAVSPTPENRELLELSVSALDDEVKKIKEKIAEIQLSIVEVSNSGLDVDDQKEFIESYKGDLTELKLTLDKFEHLYNILEIIHQNLFPEDYTGTVLQEKVSTLLDKVKDVSVDIADLEAEFTTVITPLIDLAVQRKKTLDGTQKSSEVKQLKVLEEALLASQRVEQSINQRKQNDWEAFLNSPAAPAVVKKALSFLETSGTIDINKVNWRELLDLIASFYNEKGELIEEIGADEDFKRTYIETQVIGKLNELKKEFGKKFNIPEVIDPNNIWQSFALIRGYIEPGDDPNTLESVEKIEVGMLAEFIHLLETSLEDDPNAGPERHLDNLLAFSIQKGSEKLTYGDLVDKHPGIHGNERGSQDHLRKYVTLLEHNIKGGASWGEVAKMAQPSHEKIKEHLAHYLVTGEDFELLAHFPIIPPPYSSELGNIEIENDKKFGDLIFEGFSWYCQWNDVFVYHSEAEINGVRNDISQKVSKGDIKLPSVRQLEEALNQLEQGKGDEVSGNNTNISNETLLLTYIDSNRNYTVFEQSCAELIAEKLVVAAELDRQKRYGIFPLTEAGRAKNTEKGVLVEHLDKMRKEIAIAIGCYRLGLGEYIPDAGVKNGGKVEIINPEYNSEEPLDNNKYIFRDLSHAEREKAYHVGKGAAMFAFQLYERSCGHFNDDGVNAKSAITAHRLHLTQLYRRNYADFGREGVFKDGIDVVISLLPDYLTFLAVDGEAIRTLVSDREKRMHADYKNLGEDSGAKKTYVELYGFAENIYNGVAYSLSKVVSGADPLKFAVEEKPQGALSLETYLDFQDPVLQNIIEYGDKQVGYWIDRLYIKKSVRDSEGSIYDREFWADVPGTDYASPLVHMLNLPDSDWIKISADIKEYGFKPALRKPIMTVIFIESLMRSGQKLATLAQIAGFKYVLSGKIPDYYALQAHGVSKDAVLSLKRRISGLRSYSDFFKYSEGEVQRMLDIAGIYMEPGISIGLKRLGAV